MKSAMRRCAANIVGDDVENLGSHVDEVQQVSPISPDAKITAMNPTAYTTLWCSLSRLAGSRHITISNRKTKAEFAQQIEYLNTLYPQAETIRLVMDNYSTHKLNCLYEVFPAAQARELARKLEVHYTPKHASWLNMVEIELSILARQCLKDARIPSPEVLQDIATTYEKRRNQQQAKITWAFKIPDARTKLNHLYSQVYVP